MIHDIYYERQCALIERAKQAEREREELRNYRREKAGRDAYVHLMRTKRHELVRECKGHRSQKEAHASISKCEKQVYRTRRFDGSYITVYCKGRPTA